MDTHVLDPVCTFPSNRSAKLSKFAKISGKNELNFKLVLLFKLRCLNMC